MSARVRALAEEDSLPPAHDVTQGCSADLAQLYRHEAPRLLRQLSGRISIDRAHDVVQQVFVRVTARANRDGVFLHSSRAYLNETARNLLRDDARIASRSRAEAHIPFCEETTPGVDPIAHLEARDRLARIEAAVSKMKPLTRQIFLARRVDGYSYDEIARRTGLSVRGVEKQMSRALRQLGRHLRDG